MKVFLLGVSEKMFNLVLFSGPFLPISCVVLQVAVVGADARFDFKQFAALLWTELVFDFR